MSSKYNADRKKGSLDDAVRKLETFKELYSSYRKEELTTQLARSILPFQREDASVTGPQGAPTLALSTRTSQTATARTRRRSSSSSLLGYRPQHSQAQSLLSPVAARVSPDRLSNVKLLLRELETKDHAPVHAQGRHNKLQAQAPEALDGEDHAGLKRKVQQLHEKLAATADHVNRLETERWEVLDAVSTVAAGSAQLDREQRELERARLELAEKQREMAALEARAHTSVQIQASASPLHFTREDLSSLVSHYTDLETTLGRTDAAVRRRRLLLTGQDSEIGSTEGRSVSEREAPGRLGLDHDPCLHALKEVREGLVAAAAYLAAHVSAERPLSQMSVAPVLQHLQQQATGIGRALLQLASDTADEAARLARAEAKDRERDAQLAALLAEQGRLAERAAAAAQAEALAHQLQEQRQENEAMQSRMRSMRKKLKVAFEEMAAQNKDLREKLATAQSTRSDDGDRLLDQAQRLKGELAEAGEQLKAQQERDLELVAELREARQQAVEAKERMERLRAEAQAAEARAAELETVLRMEREGALKAAADYEAQLANLRAEVKQQLQLVVDAYSEELAALHAQLARVEQAQQRTPSPRRSAVGPAAAAAAAAGAGRAEAWRMAYEEVRELAHSLKAQLDGAEAENTRLQVQLQRLTAAAVASAAASLAPHATAQQQPRQAGQQQAPARARSAAPMRPQPAPAAAPGAVSPVSVPRRPATIAGSTQGAGSREGAVSRAVTTTSPPRHVRSVAVETEPHPSPRPWELSPLSPPPATALTDATAATERPETRQQAAQTESPPAHAQVAAPESVKRATNKLVIVLRQEPTGSPAIAHAALEPADDDSSVAASAAARSPASAQASAPTGGETHRKLCGRSTGGGGKGVGNTHDSRSGGGSRKESPRRAAKGAKTSGRNADADLREGEGDRSGSEGSSISGSSSGDSGDALDTTVLGEHVAALQEQLAALTFQNSVITSQVIEICHRQEAHKLEQERRSRDVSPQGQSSSRGDGSLPHGSSPSRSARPPLFTAAAAAVFGGAGSPARSAYASPPQPSQPAAGPYSPLHRSIYPDEVAVASPYPAYAPDEGPAFCAPAHAASPARSERVHILGSSLRAPEPEEQDPPQPPHQPVHVAAELALLRAQYAQLQTRYELQAVRQHELQEALLQASGKSAHMPGRAERKVPATCIRPASAAPSYAAATAPDPDAQTAARLTYPRFDMALRRPSGQSVATAGTAEQDRAPLQEWLYPPQGLQPQHAAQHGPSLTSQQRASSRAPAPGVAAGGIRGAPSAQSYSTSLLRPAVAQAQVYQDRGSTASMLPESRMPSSSLPASTSDYVPESGSSDGSHLGYQGHVQEARWPELHNAGRRLAAQPSTDSHRPQEHSRRSRPHVDRHRRPPKTLRLHPPPPHPKQQPAAPSGAEWPGRWPEERLQQPSASGTQAPSRVAPAAQPSGRAQQQHPAPSPSQPSSRQAAPGGGTVAPAPSLTGQRSSEVYIATTPFFPLGPETSEFLDRATSVEVGLHHDPDLATTAADAAMHYEHEGEAEEEEGEDEQGRATPGSGSSTYLEEEDEGEEEEGEEDDEEDGILAAAHTVSSVATGSSASSAAAAAGAAEGDAHGSWQRHTTSSFMPTQSSNRQHRRVRHSQSERAIADPPAGSPQSAAHNPLDGPLVPPEVLERMAQYAGDEGLARPSTAVPSALRADSSDRGPPVPPEVLSYLEQYTGGGEGDVRPSTASPSVLRAGASREVPVPPEVLSYMQQYTGEEGGARPSSAAPSVLSASRSLPELPVPELVLHMAAQFQAGGEGISRPTTAPSSDERRARLAAGAPTSSQPFPGVPEAGLPATARGSVQGSGVGTGSPEASQTGFGSSQETQQQQHLAQQPQRRLQLQPPPPELHAGDANETESADDEVEAGRSGYPGWDSVSSNVRWAVGESPEQDGFFAEQEALQRALMGQVDEPLYEGEHQEHGAHGVPHDQDQVDGWSFHGLPDSAQEAEDGEGVGPGGYWGAMEEGPGQEKSGDEEEQGRRARESYASSSATFRNSLPQLQLPFGTEQPQGAQQQQQQQPDFYHDQHDQRQELDLYSGGGEAEEEEEGEDEEGGAFRVVVGSWLQGPPARGADTAGRPAQQR